MVLSKIHRLPRQAAARAIGSKPDLLLNAPFLKTTQHVRWMVIPEAWNAWQ